MKKNIISLIIMITIGQLFCKNKLAEIIHKNEKLETVTLYKTISEWNDFSKPDKTGLMNFENSINDTLNAPYYVYIPKKYDEDKRTPVIIYLHGGIGRPNFPEKFDEYIEENSLLKFAKKENWIMLFPEANLETFWWELSGMNNIADQLRFLKNNYNIDDDKVYLTGFSDGASGSFQMALSKPDNFASFYPQNGNMIVGNADAKQSIYLKNFSNRFIKAINTDKDGLYPAEQMRKLYKVSIDAGADLLYSEFWGIGHSPDYAEYEYPVLIDLMKIHPRNISQSQIFWECDDVEYGKCDWIEITKLDTLKQKKNWQKQYQATLTDTRISIGYFPDNEFPGVGDRVMKVVENSVAAEIGLHAEDIIIEFDGNEIVKSDDIYKNKKLKKRGDEFSLLVLRNDKKVLLKGKFPDPVSYEAFKFYRASGAVNAIYYGNNFDIQTSRVDEIAIYINPKMVNLSIPVNVTLNGELVFSDKLDFDREFMIKNFMDNYDRKAVWVNKLILKVNLN